jgi:hypothetical protein
MDSDIATPMAKDFAESSPDILVLYFQYGQDLRINFEQPRVWSVID